MSKENPCSSTCGCVDNPEKPAEPLPGAPQEFKGFKAKNLPEPTRFGDWEVGGRCSDF